MENELRLITHYVLRNEYTLLFLKFKKKIPPRNFYLEHRIRFCILATLFLFVGSGYSQSLDCRASLDHDTLMIANNKITGKWFWNKGDLKIFSLESRGADNKIEWAGQRPAFSINQRSFKRNISLKIDTLAADFLYPAHLSVTLVNEYDGVNVKKVFRIFPNTPTISCQYYLQYKNLFEDKKYEQVLQNDNQMNGTEKILNEQTKEQTFLQEYGLVSPHWKMTTVTFKDVTDKNDNLVFEKESLPYRHPLYLQGNLLFAEDLMDGDGFFLLKEAPNTTNQVNYPGFDFLVSENSIQIPFSGFPFNGSGAIDWIKGYTVTLGMVRSQTELIMALRTYLKNSTVYDPATHEMVMMNTWGDRGQDSKINEKFILKELEASEKLGISHFQIDDGWQQGLSKNSRSTEGKLWDAWPAENWEPNKSRFPNGLKKVVSSAKDKNISLGLWFHPSNKDNYGNWERDARVVTELFRKTGIRYFKIDGVEIPNKQAEINLGKFFDRAKMATNNKIFFNLDLTSGVRGGYFTYRSLGNFFLENRYTDWGNYYPYRTLRNLWMLAKYFPPELLQVEFLNNQRNQNKYSRIDPFAPINYDFEYLFAITMAGQPLAWFEAIGLSKKDFKISNTIEKYRDFQADFHAGQIFPIGNEPSGRSWTGFQSIKEGGGYFLIFREDNEVNEQKLSTYLPAGCKVTFKKLLGNGKISVVPKITSADGTINCILPQVNSFVLVAYEIN